MSEFSTAMDLRMAESLFRRCHRIKRGYDLPRVEVLAAVALPTVDIITASYGGPVCETVVLLPGFTPDFYRSSTTEEAMANHMRYVSQYSRPVIGAR